MTMQNAQRKKLVLVDGSSYLFRAFHALPPLMTSTGIPTGAIYGVINMLRKLLQDEKPDYFAVIFDTKAKNFRHEAFPEYKANRAQMADELSCQIAPLFEVIHAMGLPLITLEGYEADDIIATFAVQATQKNIETVISTGDKDLAQLVDEHVTLVNTMTGTVLDPKNVVAKFGVRADQIIDYLALIGDSVDNIPGIPKVGPKTAVKWLEQYQTLENIITHQDAFTGKVGEYLREHIPQLPLYKTLVTVLTDVPVLQAPEDLMTQPPVTEDLKALYKKLEFKNWLRDLESKNPESTNTSASTSAPVTKAEYEIICTEADLDKWIAKIQQTKACAISLQTDKKTDFKINLIGFSLAVKAGEAAYVPLAHQSLEENAQLPIDKVLAKIKSILEDSTIQKIGHDWKAMLAVLVAHDICIQNAIEDIMLQSYVLGSTVTKHDIDALASHYLQYETITLESLVGKGAKQIPMHAVEIPQAAAYAAEQADIILRLYDNLHAQLAAIPILNTVYTEIELPLVLVLSQMEQQGILVDAHMLEQQSEALSKALQALEEAAYTLAGETFNLGSPKQLQEILYEKLKFPILEKTPKGAPSTAENVLQELSENYELPRIILQHRTLSKLKSTYTDKLPLQIHPENQRVHTSYNQAVTATGRLSSTEPNLQNIPIKTLEGRKIRQAFIPASGYQIIAADYSQIELRIMAHLSKDKGLLDAFCKGEDIHRYTASEVLDIPLDQVTSEQRRSAKAINFGLIYGMSAFGLAKQLESSREIAQQYIDQYFLRYPGVKQYMDDVRHHGAQQGFVETIFGRRLYVPDINSKNMMRKKAAERTAINAPMQGTAADIIKKAMIAMQLQIQHNPDIKMLMQVHDELVFEVKASAVDQAKQMIKEIMQNTVQLSVPLEVDVGVGDNWDEAH